MKKNYVKPCSSCIVMAAEQAMLAGSKGLRITNQDFERADPGSVEKRWGNFLN